MQQSSFEQIVVGIQEHVRQRSSEQPEPLPQPLRIMCFDGGPSGPASLELLRRLEQDEKTKGLLAKTSLFCGTSNGALIALSLSKALQEGKSALQAIDVALGFQWETLDAFRPSPREWVRFVAGMAPLSGRKLSSLIERHFGERMELDDLTTRPVSVVSFNMKTQQINSFMSHGPHASKNTPISKAALAASALPFLLPIRRGDGAAGRGWFRPALGDWLIDGGVANNNPTFTGVSDALLCCAKGGEDYFWTARRYTPYLRVLSFGARPMSWTAGSDGSEPITWGWLRHLRAKTPHNFVDVLIGGASAADQRIAQMLLGVHRYHRVECEMETWRMASIISRWLVKLKRVREMYEKLADQEWNKQLELRKTQSERQRRDKDYNNVIDWVSEFWNEDWADLHRTSW